MTIAALTLGTLPLPALSAAAIANPASTQPATVQPQASAAAASSARRQLNIGLTRLPTAADSVQGLIVRLKQAAPHISSGNADRAADEKQRQRDILRWRAVRQVSLRGIWGVAEPMMRASGRDQQLLSFGRVLTPAEAELLAQRLREHPDVEWVTLNTLERRLQSATQVSNDPLSPEQWWLKPSGGTDANALIDRRRGVPGFVSAWATGLTGTGTAAAATGAMPVVAVLDTGITAHPDLVGRVLPGYDFVSDAIYANDGDGRDADASDPGDWVSADERKLPRFSHCAEQRSSWHGTVIAGLVAANIDNALGVAGIDRQARILPVRVAGKCGAALADIIDGMRWAAGLAVAGVPTNPNPARIINISFGGAAACGVEYQAAVDELLARGVVVVAAAGNDHGAVARPANCRGVVGVAALNRDGFKTHYSAFGPALASSGLATVGGDDARSGAWRELLSDGGLVTVWNAGATGPGEAQYAKLFGTSFAAPLVAGTLSLMLGVNPQLTAQQMIEGLRKTVRPHVNSSYIGVCSDANPGRCLCTQQSCGAGMLDAEQALRYAAQPVSYAAPVRAAAVLDSPELRQAAALGPDLPANAGATSLSVAGIDNQGNTVAANSGSATGTTGSSATVASSGGGGGLAGWQASGWLLLATWLLRRLGSNRRR